MWGGVGGEEGGSNEACSNFWTGEASSDTPWDMMDKVASH